MANNGSYSNDRPASAAAADADSSTDPASGGFFHSDYKKHEDLKQMLDSSKDSLKLEAMKRIIGMVAKGRDASDLFPAVVKNVVSKNIEVKKLVYVYLVRYAEEQQDLALLSISTFQRALKDPNQLIRAGALRVLSSIRVTMIVPIVMLAIKDSASDMSPYVRKTAAHAIPKLYSLDPEQKEELLHVIEKLLSDKTTLVVGSAVMAFEEVCPERIDLIHKNYRKLCNLLVDVDEWGQVVIINMLTRYARTQFCDPNQDDVEEDDHERPFYDEEDDDDDKVGDGGHSKKGKQSVDGKKPYSLDPDHRLLLRTARPLLQSRNASVVMGVAQLYHHLAPRAEVIVVAKALIRLLRSHREVQSIVLNCIASMSTQRKSMFEPFLKSFFVRTSDPTHIKLLKLEIVTNLATESSIAVILREFQTYISSTDKKFVAATIQAIGRCASNIKEVTDTCLSGLVSLLSNRDEAVVGESVVVIKRLLQTQPAEHSDIIAHMARLVDNISVPAAKASILWLLGEYSDRVPRIAPDVLRKMAKTFINEEDMVKVQILNLAVKLVLVNPQQSKLLCQYVLNLARYDSSYDIRDRARLLKQFVSPTNENSKLVKQARKIFLATKPAPISESQFKDREQFQLGSLSHYINARAVGYHDLAAFPAVAPDSSLRDVSPPHTAPDEDPNSGRNKKQTLKRRKITYSDTSLAEEATEDWDSSGDDSDTSESSSDDSSEDSSSDDSDSSESSDDDDEDDEDDDDDDSSSEDDTPELPKSVKIVGRDKERKSDSTSDSKNDDSDDSSQESDSDSDAKPARWSTGDGRKKSDETVAKQTKESAAAPRSNLDLLLELDDIQPTLPVLTPSLGGFLSPVTSPLTTGFLGDIQATGPSFVSVRSVELINKVAGSGLSVAYRFTRSVHLFSTRMVAVELILTNMSSTKMADVQMCSKNLQAGMAVHEFAPIGVVSPGSSVSGTIGVDWNDTTQPVSFAIQWNVGDEKRQCNVSLKPAIGELLRPVTMSETKFTTELGKLRGMNEHSYDVQNPSTGADPRLLSQRVYEVANLASVPSSEPNVLRYAGQTLASLSLVLVTARLADNRVALSVNCEKMVVGSMLLNDIRSHLRS